MRLHQTTTAFVWSHRKQLLTESFCVNLLSNQQNQADFLCSVRRSNTQTVQKSPFSVGQYKTKFAVVCCKIPPPPPPPPPPGSVHRYCQCYCQYAIHNYIYALSVCTHSGYYLQHINTPSLAAEISVVQKLRDWYQWYRNYGTGISGRETTGLLSVVQQLQDWYQWYRNSRTDINGTETMGLIISGTETMGLVLVVEELWDCYQWYRNSRTDISGTETPGLISVVQKLWDWYQWYRNYGTDISGTETTGLISVVEKLRDWYQW